MQIRMRTVGGQLLGMPRKALDPESQLPDIDPRREQGTGHLAHNEPRKKARLITDFACLGQ